MDNSSRLLQLAALLERAYRLALDVQDDLLSTGSGSPQAAAELVDVLDDARVSVLQASRPIASGRPALARTLDDRQMTAPIA